MIAGIGLSKGGLRVDDFENRSLAVLVPEGGEANTVGSEFGGSRETRQFV